MEKNSKKKFLIGALAVLLVAICVGGTVAWLTANDQATNTFTVGSFETPDKEPNPDQGGDEDEKPSDTASAKGFLFETEWPLDDSGNTISGQEPKLMPGAPTAKNPNVGIGDGGDDAYVFIYVKNNALTDGQNEDAYKANAPYFTIEHQWKAVTTEGAAAATSSNEGGYIDGLFMYVGDETDSTDPVVLPAPTGGATNAYTGELFEDITMPQNADAGLYNTTQGNITVYAYIYAADDAATGNEEGTASDALDEAIAWANGLAA